MSEGCVFCDQGWMREAEIFIETPHCIFASTRDPDIRARAGLAEGVLPGSGAIVPIAHRTSVFELTPAEWADTRDLLLRARMALHDLLAPDGYLLGWNQGGVLHPHMHVIPRFDAASARRCLIWSARRNPANPDQDARPARRTSARQPVTTWARPSSATSQRRKPAGRRVK